MEFVTISKRLINSEHDIVLYISKNACWNTKLKLLCLHLGYTVYQRVCDPNILPYIEVVKDVLEKCLQYKEVP